MVKVTVFDVDDRAAPAVVQQTTIDGYYTSAIGIHQDLEYQGNTALAEFPGCTHPEHKE